MDQIHEIWQSNGFPSVSRLWKILQQQGLTNKYNLAEIHEYIEGQNTTQLHKKPARVGYSPITTTNRGIMYCIDLLDMSAYSHDNNGMKWLLLCIDIFSRRAAIRCVKNKTANLVSEALQECIDDLGIVPKVILSDQGSEFKGATGKLLEKLDIIHRTAEVGDHRRLGIVDRFSGVVKLWIAKFMTYNQTKRYVDELPVLLENYNKSPHSSLGGMTPNEAWNYPHEARDYHYEKIKKALKQTKLKSNVIRVGDHVRVLKLKQVFDKGYHIKYSMTPHKVVDIKGLNYFLENGRFYRLARLRKIPAPTHPGEENAPADVAKQARTTHRVAVKLKTDGIEPSNLRRSNRERKPTEQVEDVRYGRIKYS
jgi:transposase InsO family protein